MTSDEAGMPGAPVALAVPGSKSVTHRAFLLGALSSVPCRVDGPLLGADCLSTLGVLRALGARFTVGERSVAFEPIDDFAPADAILDCGNSGTTLRLMLGQVARLAGRSTLTGDDSLRTRPNGPLLDALRRAGASCTGRALAWAPTSSPRAGASQRASDWSKGRRNRAMASARCACSSVPAWSVRPAAADSFRGRRPAGACSPHVPPEPPMDLADFQARFDALTRGLEHPRVATALALVEEAGEVARCVLDQEVYGSAPSDALLDEIGDTLAALSEVCSRHGLSMEAAAERVLAKVEHRAPRWREQLGERLVQLRARWDGPASP